MWYEWRSHSQENYHTGSAVIDQLIRRRLALCVPTQQCVSLGFPRVRSSLRASLLAGVLAVSVGAQQPAPPDTVRGAVFDSIAGEPLVGAFIVGKPSSVSGTTDSLGRFELVSSRPVEQLTVYHASLDAMGLGALTAARPTAAATWHAARVATPSLRTLWTRVCDTPRPEVGRSGIITGTAQMADRTTRVSGARVIVQWRAASGTQELQSADALTDSLGNFVVCGIEDFAEPRLAAISAQANSGVVALPSEMRALRRVDLVLAEVTAPRSGAIRGRVVTQQRTGVKDVRVQLDGVEAEVLTASDGSFRITNAPLGSRMISLRAVGYTPVAQAVDVIAGESPALEILFERAVELEGVYVTERANIRPARAAFEQRRTAGWAARFVDSTEIVNAPSVRAALNVVRGITVGPAGGRATNEFEIRGQFGCRAHIFFDGTASNIEEVNRIPPTSIASIEVYASMAFAPGELIQVRTDNCAVVAFWTKYGLRP
jgi:hypothetical protein